ncbi:MAG TPA: single-stranded DNA-binding protein, partial [Micrococcaceae bacterium]
GHSNWYSVSSYRHLAQNVAFSIRKGDPVVVYGRLKVRPWINDQGRTGTNVDIEADTVSHDLRWGVAQFKRGTGARRGTGVTDGAGFAAGPNGDEEEAEETAEAAAYDRDSGAAAPDDADGQLPPNLDPETGELREGQPKQEEAVPF